MNLQPIKFRNVAHLQRVIKDYLAIAGPLSGIVAAILSLWKWEQNDGNYRLGHDGDTCANCQMHYGEDGCCSCSMKLSGKGCGLSLSYFHDTGNKQPLLEVLHNAVLYECVEEYSRRCVESVREGLK